MKVVKSRKKSTPKYTRLKEDLKSLKEGRFKSIFFKMNKHSL